LLPEPNNDGSEEVFMTVTSCPVIVITGPVGAGKSTVGDALSDLLKEREIAHGVIDVDYLRWCSPAPPNDPFHYQLGLRNLASVGAAYRDAGATCLVVIDVVEHRRQIADYEEAIPGGSVTIVRLRVPMTTIERRLRGRNSGASLAWHLARAPELERIFDENQIEDLAIDCGDRTPAEIAVEIADRMGLRTAPVRKESD
jgi:adenylylsulfate kinase